MYNGCTHSLTQGLADESEFIRDTSLQAGQTLVSRYGDKAVELFLPQLEQGLFDANWRIRYTHTNNLYLFGLVFQRCNFWDFGAVN